MAAGFLSPIGLIAQYLFDRGIAGAGYLLNTYFASSMTRCPTYTDSSLTVENANPIVLYANGRLPFSVWARSGTLLKMVITDSLGTVIQGGTIDNLPGINDVSIPIYGRSATEIAAGVAPTNYMYPELEPRRYGAVGDGVTVDTAALNTWVAVVNMSTNPVSNWLSGQTYLCGPLNVITAMNFTWNCFSTLKVVGNSWIGLTSHVQIAGKGARVYGLSINGNQGAFTAAPSGQLLSLTGDDVLLDGVQLTNSGSRGALLNTIVGGRVSNCHFDSNANAGIEFETVSYLKLVNCTFNHDGYGFKRTLATNTFSAFGFALRFRSHHCEFVACEALGCGRDGMNVNQGSYAIKFIACLAWKNCDGGFTIAADDISSGRPGERESCYDLEYVDCEAWNNWSSGLAAYAICHNVTVDGGRYYNNHLVAGVLPETSAYFSGLYFSGGCLGIRVRTKAYDDRQLCPIKARSGRDITATGWVPGTMANYPRVALYNAGKVFQGYGNLSEESAGRVNIRAAVNSGVTIANIVAGWFVSQRVQHNGCFFDNGCTGSMDIDGFGQLPGMFTFTGFKSMSGYTAGGQNVLLPAGTIDYTELLANPTFDVGTGSGTTWIYNLPGGGLANHYTTAGSNIRSAGALQLIGGTSAAAGDSVLIRDGLNYVQGAWVEASIWCNSIAAGDSSLSLFWNPGGTGVLATVVNHPGGGYKQLKIGAFIAAGTTQLTLRVTSAIGKTNYFDNASLRVKSDHYDNRDFAYPARNLPANPEAGV
ncbi:MAG TPA: right-handed parallel beta-helix repeat-containing protein [Steroidobacteraceae bacterium]|jgi:hypothetical protein